MNRNAFKLALLVFTLFTFSALSQNKIAIDDRVNIINNQVDSLLSNKFSEKNLQLNSAINFTQRCDYFFPKIYLNNDRLLIDVEDCDGRLIGSKSTSSSLLNSSNEEKAIVIFHSIFDVIENPLSNETSRYEEAVRNEVNEEKATMHPDSMISEHDSRYFFAPSALPLKKEELYYNSLYFLLHDIQYGVTDRLTVGMGTTIIGLPVYFTAKYSIPLQEKSHLAIGNLLLVGTYGTNFLGNLAFATYTYGSSHSNFSLGGGHLYFDPGNNSGESSSVVGNLSGILRAGKYFYFLSENYLFSFQNEQSASRVTSLPDGTFVFQEGEFNVRRNIWYGLTGIRFVRKTNELVSWQLGLTHMLIVNSEIPAPYNSQNWNPDSFNPGTTFVTFPTLSYTRKFKL